ncbi:MaoC family dehydratase N-terminal domain-containing protein [Streptomyces sp. NPDC051018]|uniref:FAS1-like dehydratase domain-containing protein n=1 Tax=Streptomyces sp. NPDC051018 TaxID=3365639 RepID=UPI0037A012B1
MSYTMPIELGKIREFARAVKTRHVAHKGSTPVIPPTFLLSSRTLWEPVAESGIARLGFDMRRILHGEEEYVFHGPLPAAGQTLTCEAKVVETYEKPGKRGGSMRFGVVVTEFRDEKGTLVAEARSTLVETEKAPKKDEG